MKAHITGPTLGRTGSNFDAFEYAASQLRGIGYEVSSLHELLLAASDDVGCYLAGNVQAVMEADVLVLLPGWRDEPGVMVEMIVAEATGTLAVTLHEALSLTSWRSAQRRIISDFGNASEPI